MGWNVINVCPTYCLKRIKQWFTILCSFALFIHVKQRKVRDQACLQWHRIAI